MFQHFRRRRRRQIRRAVAPLLEDLTARLAVAGQSHDAPAVAQLALLAQYRGLAQAGGPMPTFREVGFRCHSQNEEDGILLYVFALLGMASKRCVEIGAGDGIENNTANLLVNHRFTGLLVDGDEANVEKARAFYAACPDTRYWPPKVLRAWVTKGGIDALVREHAGAGEIDLLSIDVDGVDWWIWQALDCVRPRVVVTEVNHLWGPEASVTVPYRDDFRAEFTEWGSDYAGASLAAFVKLGREGLPPGRHQRLRDQRLLPA